MQYSTVDGKKISKVMLGTVQLGMAYGIANKSGKPTEQEAFALLDAAFEGGINAVDTANAYGDSEAVIGRYFAARPARRSAAFVGTKFKLSTKLNGAEDGDIERMVDEFAEESLSALGVPKLAMLMLHDYQDVNRFGSRVESAFKRLIRDGLIERAGVSVYKSAEIDEVLRHDVYTAVQFPMNAFDTSFVRDGVLGRIKERGMLAFVRSVFLQGMFFLEPDELPDTLASTKVYLGRFRAVAADNGYSVAQLALAFIRDMEGVTSLVLGAETAQQVLDNIRLVDCGPLCEKARGQLAALSAEVPIDVIMNEFHARARR